MFSFEGLPRGWTLIVKSREGVSWEHWSWSLYDQNSEQVMERKSERIRIVAFLSLSSFRGEFSPVPWNFRANYNKTPPIYLVLILRHKIPLPATTSSITCTKHDRCPQLKSPWYRLSADQELSLAMAIGRIFVKKANGLRRWGLKAAVTLINV